MKSMLHSSMGTFKEIEDATITAEKISHLFLYSCLCGEITFWL